MTRRNRRLRVSLAAAAVLLGGCFLTKSKKGFENFNVTVPASHFKTIATIAGGTGRNDIRMMVQVRQDLQKAGLNAVRSAGRWESVAGVIAQVCAPGAEVPVDGLVIVSYDHLVLYDCQNSKAAFEMQASSQTGITEMTARLIKYLTRKPSPS